MESAIVYQPKVAEAAVIGQEDEDTGQAISAFVILEGETDEGDEALEGEIRERVAQRIGSRRRQADHLDRRRSEDPLRKDHAPAAARHRRGAQAADVTTLREPGVMKDLEEKFAGDDA